MKIKVYNSVGGAAFFRRLLEEWRQAGSTVKLHEAISEEDYRAPRGQIRRLLVRWKMYGGFAWSSWWAVRSEEQGARSKELRAGGESDAGGVRVVATNPFFLPALVAKAAGKQGATINLLYDLYPEALIQAGKIGADSWLARRCAAITRYALRECAVTVFLGEHLRAYAEATYGPARRAEIIPVGADGVPFKDHPPQSVSPGQSPRILYCGQMGRMHDVDTLLVVWGSEEAAACEWVFHASGAGYARLRAAGKPETGNLKPEGGGGDGKPETGNRGGKPETEDLKPEAGNLKSETGNQKPEGSDSGNSGLGSSSGLRSQPSGFAPHSSLSVFWGKALPDAAWVEAMNRAQVALVTISPGAERVVMPSKTYSALVAGQAVLAVCPARSDLADLVRKHDCGWVVEPGDAAGLRAVLREIATQPAVLQAKRERAFAAGHAFYDSAVVAKQWLVLFSSLTEKGR